jgi:hypothetical protein
LQRVVAVEEQMVRQAQVAAVVLLSSQTYQLPLV